MRETAIVKLDARGVVTLPEEIRYDLPSGTHFLVRRHKQNIILLPVPPQSSSPFDLSAEAFGFVNELTDEGYEDYLSQVGLTSTMQAQ